MEVIRATAILLICLCALSTGVMGEELLFYRHDAEMSNYRSVEMTIKSDGAGSVHYDRVVHRDGKSEPQQFDYAFRLDPAELSALKARIHSVGFFDQPSEDTQFATDVGKTTMRVSLDGKKRDLTFRYRMEMRPLTDFIQRLVNQGQLLKDLNDQGSVYEVLSSVSPNMAYLRALQPEAFVAPLSEFMDREQDWQKQANAVGALEAVSTPNEFIGILFEKLEKAQDERRAMLIKAITYGNQQYIHTDPPKEALAALLLKYVRQDGPQWSQLSAAQRASYGAAIRLMAEQRYEPAIPVLAAMVPDAYNDVHSGVGYAFNKMPWQTVAHIEPLLQAERAETRSAAAWIIGNLLDVSPDPKAPPADRENILKHLRTNIAPTLDKVAKDDPDQEVRSAATRALESIGREWKDS